MMTLCIVKPGPKPRADRNDVRRAIRINLPPLLILAVQATAKAQGMPVSRAYEEAAGLWLSYARIFREQS